MEDNLKNIRSWTGNLNLKNEEFLNGFLEKDLANKLCLKEDNFSDIGVVSEEDFRFDDSVSWKRYYPEKVKVYLVSEYLISFLPESDNLNSIVSTNLVFNPKINLNRLMSSNLVFGIRTSQDNTLLSKISIRSLYFLSNYATGKEVSKDADYIKIPLALTYLLDNWIFNLLRDNDWNFYIEIFNEKLSFSDYYLEIGSRKETSFSTNFRGCVNICGSFSNGHLGIHSDEVRGNFSIINFTIYHPNVTFIVAWYIIDEESINSLQSLQPVMLEAKIRFKIKDDYHVKIYDKKDIKVMKVGNYTGYMLPVNTLSFTDIINYFKSKNKNKIFREILNELIKWTDFAECKLEISWSNHQPGFKIILEPVSIDRVFVSCFGSMYQV